MKTPCLFVPILVLAATLLGCETMPTQEKTTSGTVPPQPIKVAENKGEIMALVNNAVAGYIGALPELRIKAEKGSAYAQLALGKMYAEGQGVPKDEVEAVKWYAKAL